MAVANLCNLFNGRSPRGRGRGMTNQIQTEEGQMFNRTAHRALFIALGVLLAGSLLAACGNDKKSGGGGGGGGKSGTIALLLPESQTARYESQDRPLFTKRVKALCPNCTVLYSNANQQADTQQQQAEAALTKGAKVLVLDAVDAGSAASIVAKAKQQKVPVVSYDRLVSKADLDYYISFDNEKVGKLQGTALTSKLKADGKKGDIVMINGDPADNNAALFKKGAHSVIDSSGFKVAKESDTPGWLGPNAQREMEQAITAVGKTGFVGVYAANDTLGGATIAAMKGNGIDPKTRPTTGQDAELAGIQRILNGEQYMTVYKAVKPEAAGAAQLAVALLQGKAAPSGLVNSKIDNGQKQVPAVILKPIAVTKANIKDTVVKDGFWTAKQICTAKYAAACKAAGIQ
jgi:D-xylose transport system substrate-binding protein